MKSVKNPYRDIFAELAEGLDDHMTRMAEIGALPYDYTRDDFENVTRIFLSGLIYKVWEKSGKIDASATVQAIKNFDKFIKEHTSHDLRLYGNKNSQK